MVRMVNRLTGTEMLVHESKVEKMLAAGHKPVAASPEETAPAKKAQPKKKKG